MIQSYKFIILLLLLFSNISFSQGEANGDCSTCCDGIDNDGDGFVDWDDFDCNQSGAPADDCPYCSTESSCDNGVDDDGDGLVDGDDPDCDTGTTIACDSPIWIEDFESYTDGTQNTAKWTTDFNDCDDADINNGANYWGVQNGEFRVNDIEGLTCCGNNGESDNVWLSEIINISAYAELSISLETRVSGAVECADCTGGGDLFTAQYSVDGGAWNTFYTICGADAGFTETSCNPITLGDNLQIRILVGNQANSEDYYFDNIRVCPDNCFTSCASTITGTLEACVGSTSQLTGSGTPAGTNPWASSDPSVATIDEDGLVTTFSAGNTVITYIDDAGCIGDTVFTVNPLPTVIASNSGPICEGQTVTLTENGGEATTWTWTSLNGTATIATPTASSTDATGVVDGEEFQVVATDDAGCSDSTTTIVSVNALPTVTSVTGGDTYCQGDVISNIEVAVTGTADWIIDYTLDGVAQTPVTGSTSPISLGNATGVYVVTGIADANCSNTANGTQTITVNPLPTVTSVTGGNTYCQGDVVSNIEVAVTGTADWIIDYTLDGVAQTPVTGSISPISLGNATGVYVVTGIADANCSNTANGTQTITVNPNPVIDATGANPSSCSNLDGTIDAVLSSGPTSTGVLSWTGTTNSSVGPQDIDAESPDINGLGAGTYNVTFTDANGCNSNTVSVDLLLPESPSATITGADGSYCNGTSSEIDVTIEFTGSGGPWDFIYAIDGVDQPAIIGYSSTNYTISNATSGVYTLSSVVESGCNGTTSGSATIVENPLPTVTLVTGGGTYCQGDVVSNIEVAVTGTADWIIDYTLDGVAQIPVTGSTSPISLGDAPGVYVVTGIADANCSNTANGTQTITVNPLPTVTSVTGGDTYCQGELVADITVEVTGTADWIIDYTLDGVAQTPITGSTSPNSLGNAPGVYVVTGIADANCSNAANGTQTITVNENPTVSITPNPAEVCAEDNLVMNGNPTGGDGNYQHLWTEAGASLLNDPSIEAPIFNSATSGSYDLTYTVTDGNTCTGSEMISVTVFATPVIDPLGPITACDSYTLPTITGTNVSSNAAYYDDTQANGGQLVTGPITQSGTYYMYEGLSGCSDEEAVSVTINPLPSVDAGVDLELCEGESVILNATGDAASYTWDNGTINGESITPPVGSYTYTVIAASAEGCTSSDDINITTNPQPVAEMFADPINGPVPLDVNFENVSSNGTSYIWEFGNGDGVTNSTNSDENYTYTDFGVFNVVLLVINGNCSDTAMATITVEDLPLSYDIPNIFTPNDDEVNDTFHMNLVNAESVEIEILNRWGNIVGKVNSVNPEDGWNGTTPEGVKVSDGVYFYTYKIVDLKGNIVEGHHFLHVVR